jgi:hypothetical protein
MCVVPVYWKLFRWEPEPGVQSSMPQNLISLIDDVLRTHIVDQSPDSIMSIIFTQTSSQIG